MASITTCENMNYGRKPDNINQNLCRNGNKCFKKNCTFSHPEGKDRIGLTKGMCKSDHGCYKNDCKFYHTHGIYRAGLNIKIKDKFTKGNEVLVNTKGQEFQYRYDGFSYTA